MEEKFSIVNLTKIKIPNLTLPNKKQAFSVIKNDILGEKYSLSLAYLPKAKMKMLNKTYRKKDKATNILSFPLSKNSGEILLCPAVIKEELKKFDRTFPELLGFLVIHGMLHLKGMQHSSRMEEEEKKYDQKYFYRNRLGVIHDQGNSGRISKRRKKSSHNWRGRISD